MIGISRRESGEEPLKRWLGTKLYKPSAECGISPGKSFNLLAAAVAREAALFLARTQGRLSLKELGKLAGGIHHNAVGIAIRRFAERLEKDHALLSKLSLVQKALELL